MLKGKSLGCSSNILFWNDQQKHVGCSIETMKHTLLIGDYGTGDFESYFALLFWQSFHRQDSGSWGCSKFLVQKGEFHGDICCSFRWDFYALVWWISIIYTTTDNIVKITTSIPKNLMIFWIGSSGVKIFVIEYVNILKLFI